jgi:hypothetical protein
MMETLLVCKKECLTLLVTSHITEKYFRRKQHIAYEWFYGLIDVGILFGLGPLKLISTLWYKNIREQQNTG